MARRIFIPLEVDYADDKDIAKLARYGKDARAARDLLVQMWCYCKRELSDGHVPTEQVGKLVYPDTARVGVRDADRLVACEIAERTETGYYLPGFLKRNKSRAQVEAESLAKKKAGQKGGHRSGEVRRGEAEPKQDASHLVHETKQGAGVWLNTENREQSAEDTVLSVEVNEGGNRHLALPASADTPPLFCKKHPNGHDGPCGPCADARKIHRAWFAAETERGIAAAAVAAESVKSCPNHCVNGWIEDENHDPVSRCSHLKGNAA